MTKVTTDHTKRLDAMLQSYPPDLASVARLGSGDAAEAGLANLVDRTHGMANPPQQAVWAWRELPVPVIAALYRVAYGGGLQVALGADMRFVAPGTSLRVMEMRWGLIPDMAGIVLLRELMRADLVRDLVLSARVIDAEEASRIGLVTRVCADPWAEAISVARSIAEKNPDAVRAAKRLLNQRADGTERSLLLAESIEQQALIGSLNQREAVAAAQEKRPPRFRMPDSTVAPPQPINE